MTFPSEFPASVDRNAPIGIFDSGVGGLTVARSIMDQLPHESILYIGDTANGPYGGRSISDVRELAGNIADELVARGCKMLVIACNTASAAFLRDARERYPIPVIEVIVPAVRRAVATTRNHKVGVIGTSATIRSQAYQDMFQANPGIDVTATDCPRFVDFVERGVTSGRQILQLSQGYLAPLQAAGVDTLVLGCTHYPHLSGVIQLAMGDHVTLVSSAEETAKDVLRTLSETDMLAKTPGDLDGDGVPDVEDAAVVATRRFECTGDPESFEKLAVRFLGPHVTNVAKNPTL